MYYVSCFLWKWAEGKILSSFGGILRLWQCQWEKKMKESGVNPCQRSSVGGKRKEWGRESQDWAGRIFDPSFHLYFAEWLLFWFYELQNFVKIKDRQKVRKKHKTEKRGTFCLWVRPYLMNMISQVIYTATVFQTNHCYTPSKKYIKYQPALPWSPISIHLGLNMLLNSL